MTKVINLFGGPNSGKSTVAAGLFFHLKLRHFHCEMVREYIKSWAWENKKPGTYDQPFIFGKQLRYESMLYGKVDYVITDSPLILSAFYEEFYEGESIIRTSAANFMTKATNNGVEYINFWLDMVEDIDIRGRFGDANVFSETSCQMRKWLKHNQIDFVEVPRILDGRSRVEFIIDHI